MPQRLIKGTQALNSETPAEFTIRTMRGADIPDAMRLREIAGWNQTREDWQRLLDLEPPGCFVACEGDRVRGTVTTLQYEKRFGWIGMLLTDPGSRRQGIGSSLLRRAIAYLEDNGVEAIRLDGTPMGYAIYQRNGFVDEYEIQRWEGVATIQEGNGMPPLQASDLVPLCGWDRDLFGADRRRLIASLWNENPSCSAVDQSGGEISGYALWRPGTRAWYLGPCLATTAESAKRLMNTMLSLVEGDPVFVDVCTRNSWGLDLLRPRGFQLQRSLVRMYRGSHNFPGKPEFICSIAGPELG